MKKLLMIAAVAVFGLSSVNAQDFNVGINAGLPVGDAELGYSLGIAIEANYLWEVSDEFKAGVTAGYSHFLGKSIFGASIEDAGFIPVGAAGRYAASDEFTLGLDLGYGVGISPDGNDGGVFYAPKVQYSVSDAIDVVASYRGVSVDGGTFSSINLGVEFGL